MSMCTECGRVNDDCQCGSEVNFDALVSLPNEKYIKLGEFSTIAELKMMLRNFDDECSIGFINQPKQGLYYHYDSGEAHLGFQ